MLALPQAEAQPRTVTKIHYYTISGSSALALDQQMTSRGPLHGRGRAYANIVAKPDYSGQLVQGRTCRLEEFRINAEFTMTLPRLASTSRVSKDLLERWKSFQGFVRRHEEGHRTIWLESMDKAERRISGLTAPTCPQLQDRIDQAFAEEWRAAERRQDAYDVAEQQKLVRHPLIVAAARVARQKATAIVASPPPSQARAVRRVSLGKAAGH